MSTQTDDLAEQPAKIGRFEVIDGALHIDGVPVCPLCLENAGTKFCVCTADDLDADVSWQKSRRVAA